MAHTPFSLDILAGPGGFGDGMHPTTAGMLEILQELAGQGGFANVLDMGCGSGLLSLAACGLWPECRVTAVDLQASAIETTRINSEKNGFADRITPVQANGYRHKDVVASAPFDLVLANLTADVHVELASQIAMVLAEGTLVVLAGILRWREEMVETLYEQQGLELIAEPIRIGEWTTLLMERQGDQR